MQQLSNADDVGRAAKIRRAEIDPTASSGSGRVVTKAHNDLGPPFTDDYFPYTKGQLDRCFAARRYDDYKRAWNTYYQSNTINGYKDRHYILREFVELNDALVASASRQSTTASTGPSSSTATPPPITVRWMEIGCGVGNAVMPALKEYPNLAVCGFDISSVAINLFKKKAEAEGMSHRVNVCVTNLAETDVPEGFLLQGARPSSSSTAMMSGTISDATTQMEVAAGLVDFASVIFVLSAIPQNKFVAFVRRSRALMRTGAVLFFRDYFENDMAQKRFSKENKIDESTYFRVDGTLSHFFSRDEISSLFCRENGYELIEEKIVERDVENRKDEKTMHRRWYQARFRCI